MSQEEYLLNREQNCCFILEREGGSGCEEKVSFIAIICLLLYIMGEEEEGVRKGREGWKSRREREEGG